MPLDVEHTDHFRHHAFLHYRMTINWSAPQYCAVRRIVSWLACDLAPFVFYLFPFYEFSQPQRKGFDID